MLSPSFKKTIKFICKNLKDFSYPWAFIGGTNMVLQGIDVSPGMDLDIITSVEGLHGFKKQFLEYVTSDVRIRPKTIKNTPSYYELKLNINGVEVHINGEFESDLYMRKIDPESIIFVAVDDYKVPCFDLAAEAQTYLMLKGEEKANLIEEFLAKKKLI